MSTLPTLYTRRLILRPFTLADAPELQPPITALPTVRRSARPLLRRMPPTAVRAVRKAMRGVERARGNARPTAG